MESASLWRSVSIIIPTSNEAAWLPRLLAVLTQLNPLEVIVADNFSVDGTRSVADAMGCVVVTGGKPGPGRNAGARIARGEFLLFLDADTLLTKATIRSIERHLTARDIDLMCFAHAPMTDSATIRALYVIANKWFKLLAQLGINHGLASCVLVTNQVFQECRGFDERLEPGEDVEFVRRASRGRRFGLEDDAVLISARRLDIENPVVFGLKTALWEVLRLVGSRRSVVGYKWHRYGPSAAIRETDWLSVRSMTGDWRG